MKKLYVVTLLLIGFGNVILASHADLNKIAKKRLRKLNNSVSKGDDKYLAQRVAEAYRQAQNGSLKGKALQEEVQILEGLSEL